MTESTGLPAARPRKILTQIAPVTWEHPADRAALQSLRSVPGFDEVVKKIYGFIGERGVRLIFQADAVRVGPTQFPRLNQLYTDILTSMDWPERPELFVSQTPFANAGAFGMDRPFIVINSGTLRLLDDDEVRNVLGHELGHVMSGHALYHTILVLILNVSLGALPFLAGMAILPIQLALLEWFRKSELSSDRAGLLACQDPTASLRVNLKFAGGGDMSQMDLNAFLVQAKEFEDAGGALDRIFKILGVLGRSHPFNTVRAAELFAAPGNPGIAQLGTNLAIATSAAADLAAAAREHKIDFTIVGPEAPLAAGLADALRAAGHAVFGPSAAAARIESSKASAKDVMRRAGIVTAASQTFTALDPALAYIKRHAEPLVVKASGLAAGKGVMVCARRTEAVRAARAMLVEAAVGDAGLEIVIEDFLKGEELSVLALTDGEQLLLLPAAQDHKRLGECDTGTNTAGMVAYCPVRIATPGMLERVRREVLEPVIRELAAPIVIPRDLEPGTLVFHAGTERDAAGGLRVHGGRVLTVTGLGETVGEAARRSADACELITFPGKTYRRDIGWRETREARAGAARG